MGTAVGRLKRRPDFLRVAAARRKRVMPGLILQARPRGASGSVDGEPSPRVGFTASRKVGGAVERNRARRRLKAAVGMVMGAHAVRENDYVVIARQATVDRPFDDLVADLEQALRGLGAWRNEQGATEP